MSGKSTDNRNGIAAQPTGQLSTFVAEINDFFRSFNQSRSATQCLTSITNMTQKLQTDTFKSFTASMTDLDRSLLFAITRTNIWRLDQDLKGLHTMRLAALEDVEEEDTDSRSKLSFEQSKGCSDSLVNTRKHIDWRFLTRPERLQQLVTCHSVDGECNHWAGWTKPETQVELSKAFVELKKAFATLDPENAHGMSDPKAFLEKISQQLVSAGTDASKVSFMAEQASFARSTTWTTLPQEAGLDKQIELASLVAEYQQWSRYGLAKAVKETLDAFRASERVFGASSTDEEYGFDTDAEYIKSLQGFSVE